MERLSEIPKILQLVSVKPRPDTRSSASRVCTYHMIKLSTRAERAETKGRNKTMARNLSEVIENRENQK